MTEYTNNSVLKKNQHFSCRFRQLQPWQLHLFTLAKYQQNAELEKLSSEVFTLLQVLGIFDYKATFPHSNVKMLSTVPLCSIASNNKRNYRGAVATSRLKVGSPSPRKLAMPY